jgi:predicted ATPase
MSHIIEFAIEGLAGRPDTYSERLNRHVNVFFGENGSGKTSLLKILHCALSGNVESLENVPFKSARVKFYSVAEKRAFVRTIRKATKQVSEVPRGYSTLTVTQYRQLRLFQEVASTSGWKIRPKPKTRSNSWMHRYLPISRLYSGTAGPTAVGVAGNRPLSEEALDLRFAQAMEALWTSYSADISKKVREVQQKGLANVLRAVLSKSSSGRHLRAADAGTAYGRVSAFLSRQSGSRHALGSEREFAKRYNTDTQLRRVVSDIENVERSIEVASAPRDELRELIHEMFRRDKALTFTDKTIEVAVGGTKIGLPHLSSGEKQLLLLCVETLTAGENSIIIDEPEISMHIDWQKRLVRSLRKLNPDCQMILATHSPEIMAALPDSQIFRI